ncbi:MAG TPA: transketolase C-terminal domain-containing protein, partial [Chondromyces sp.]|nr:transketolase C-terminal domain-containing protein [Chondromyces sp.]
ESKDKPTALVLTRQDLPTVQDDSEAAYEAVKRGAYVISKAKGEVAGLLLASGSEVALALEAQKELEKENIFVSVVSMPSWDRFEEQSNEYKETVLPKAVKARLAIEMGSSIGWREYVGDQGAVLAIDQFGGSAPMNVLLKEYGFTVENVVKQFKSVL